MNQPTENSVIFRQGENVTLVVTPSGHLEVYPTQALLDQADDIRATFDEKGEDETLRLLFQDITEQNDPDFVSPEDIGALTSAPIFAEYVTVNDDGEVEVEGRVWWHSKYQIESAVEELLSGRVVRFDKGND